jgi:hypothetical protein
MIWDHSDRFPPDPNAPPSPAVRAARPRAPIEGGKPAPHADPLERQLAQLRLIGPAAGAELRRIVYGHAPSRTALPTTARPR